MDTLLSGVTLSQAIEALPRLQSTLSDRLALQMILSRTRLLDQPEGWKLMAIEYKLHQAARVRAALLQAARRRIGTDTRDWVYELASGTRPLPQCATFAQPIKPWCQIILYFLRLFYERCTTFLLLVEDRG